MTLTRRGWILLAALAFAAGTASGLAIHPDQTPPAGTPAYTVQEPRP